MSDKFKNSLSTESVANAIDDMKAQARANAAKQLAENNATCAAIISDARDVAAGNSIKFRHTVQTGEALHGVNCGKISKGIGGIGT